MKKDIFTELDFHPVIKEWFRERFSRPTPAQLAGWPSIAAGRHSLILAPTGSGKTLTAFLWSIDRLLRISETMPGDMFERNTIGLHTLYISPLKALNNDIQKNLRRPLHELYELLNKQFDRPGKIRTAVRSGDTPSHVRQSMLKKPPHILITTPESLYLLLTSERGRRLFSHLKYVIVDEIHAVSDNKRGMHLSLSLERLYRLTLTEPLRIGLSATQKPLERIAAYLGGGTWHASRNGWKPRPVSIIDCGQQRPMDLKVLCPVQSFEHLPDSSTWQPVYKLLYEQINSHQTTLIFTNMRAQTEKIARRLNEIHQSKTENSDKLVMAHHGSISKERRLMVETLLKEGKIKAVIATGSLELGIDIGTIDLVVHLEAPRNVSGGLQRVGRSGHTVDAVSKGRIIPLYAADLDDALTIARAMMHNDIEETIIPENGLDVLAQQIVAEVAMGPLPVEVLYSMVKSSYCYRHLSRKIFNRVLELLNGKYADHPLKYLKPRLNWDVANNQLFPLRGSRITAVMNAGTIPDRGYYSVYLKDQNIRLGEMEEEFVHESRVGDSFYLGNSEWRIDTITPDRIIVTPVYAIRPRSPFWKGDILYRGINTADKIGQFRRQLYEKMDDRGAEQWLREQFPADEPTVMNTIRYFEKQRRMTASVCSDRILLGEWTTDDGGSLLFILHAVLGARITGLWAMAAADYLQNRLGIQAQYAFDDDGFLLRIAETQRQPDIEDFFAQSAGEVKDAIFSSLITSPMFAIHFRYNAARALILPRSQTNKRIPLWLQRLRAADLLQAVQDRTDFPIIIETYRDLLNHVFDWEGLERILDDLRQKKRNMKYVQTNKPSPMSSGLIFRLKAFAIYEEDTYRGQSLSTPVSQSMVESIIQTERIPAIIRASQAETAEQKWQHLAPETQAKDKEDVYALIEKFGPISSEALQDRCSIASDEVIKQLKEENRIQWVSLITDGWMTKSAYQSYNALNIESRMKKWVSRQVQYWAPHSIEELSRRLNLAEHQLVPILHELARENVLVTGRLIDHSPHTYWCERKNFAYLYRQAVGQRRTGKSFADRRTFYRFSLQWHGITGSARSIEHIIQQFKALAMPPLFMERELLRSRLARRHQDWSEIMASLQQLISDEILYVIAYPLSNNEQTMLRFIPHAQGASLGLPSTAPGLIQPSGSDTREVLEFIRAQGGSRGRDILTATALQSGQLMVALKDLFETGWVTGDHYPILIQLLSQSFSPKNPRRNMDHKRAGPGLHGRKDGRKVGRPRKATIRENVQNQTQILSARWMPTTAFAFRGKETDKQERIRNQAEMLLDRYGLLVKEWHRRETGLESWIDIFQTLKQMEWRDEIRRGYFVEGLSGLQFALPRAFDLLKHYHEQDEDVEGQGVIMLSTLDPALAPGGAITWQLFNRRQQSIYVTRTEQNHIFFYGHRIVLYTENYHRRWFLTAEFDNALLPAVVQCIKDWLRMPAELQPRRKIIIDRIDDDPSVRHTLSTLLESEGFEKDIQKLVLWPSAV
ncbi:MAG: DEAD/DEAH box helicase [Caldithrix sp.]|nr:DEAD/DEAH box helicase [Caldithrix sp.]